MEPNDLPWKGEISMQQVLAEIREFPEASFWLAFIRATGKDAGEMKVVSKAVYGAPRVEFTKFKTVEEFSSDRKRAVHTDKGTLPMTDTTNGHYLTPLISHICGYNLFKVKH